MLFWLSYTISWPSTKPCSFKNLIVLIEVLIPPPVNVVLESKITLLNLLTITGSSVQLEPLPPVTPIETTSFISNSCGSTKTFLTDPFITGWTKAVVPVPVETVNFGSLRTSKLLPPLKTEVELRGPKYILSFDL